MKNCALEYNVAALMEVSPQNQEQRCPLCRSFNTEPGPEVNRCPLLQNVLFKSAALAKATASTNVKYTYCPSCHFLFNPSFEDSKVVYDEHYNNNQLASNSYRAHLDDMAHWLIQKRNINFSSKILEIGCGNGYFLSRIKKSTNAEIKGFDPAYAGQYDLNDYVVRELFYSTEDRYDLIIIRSTLEGMINFGETMKIAIESLNDNGAIFIETISLDDLLSRSDFTGLFHEAARYFSFTSVQKMCANLGLEVFSTTPFFGGLNIGTIAIRRSKPKNIEKCRKKAQETVAKKPKIAIWGAAGRAVSLLCQMGWDDSVVKYAVDVDVDKQNLYLPITGQKIVSPEEILRWEPETVLVANPNYVDEIKKQFNYPVEFLTIDDINHL